MKIAGIRRKTALLGAELAARVTRTLPGALGAGCFVYSGYLIWRPLAFVAAGVFLLMIDRSTP